MLALGPDPTAFARRLLDGDDVALRQYVVDALFDRPYDAPDAITQEWIDARLNSDSREDLLLVAQAAGVGTGGSWVQLLRTLLTHPDVEVQRMALLSAKRRPSRELIDVEVPLFLLPELSYVAREAVAAIGDPAVPELERLLGGERGARQQVIAARALGRIATPRAIAALMGLARTSDPRLRYVGLQSMNRARAQTGMPVVPRSTAHKLFLRELADYRANLEPALRLEANQAPDVRLLAAGFRESAEMALERGLSALACWYEPKPLAGAFDRMRSRDHKVDAPALEYLGHMLPRAVFRPVTRIFEEEAVDGEREGAAADRDDVAEAIRAAWQWGDGWLRACAVRASRFAPSLDPQLFATGGGDDPIVSAELAALAAAGPSGLDSPLRATKAASPGGNAC